MATTTTLEKPEEKVEKAEERALRRRWDPFDIFEEMREELARFWGEPWPLVSRRPFRRLLKGPTAWCPRVDMYEKNDNVIIKADLPGLKREDIQVSVDEGDLILQGESKRESEVKEENYYCWERGAGSFYRRLALPFEIKPEKIEANFKEGVLEVRVPKPSEKKPQAQKIAVR